MNFELDKNDSQREKSERENVKGPDSEVLNEEFSFDENDDADDRSKAKDDDADDMDFNFVETDRTYDEEDAEPDLILANGAETNNETAENTEPEAEKLEEIEDPKDVEEAEETEETEQNAVVNETEDDTADESADGAADESANDTADESADDAAGGETAHEAREESAPAKPRWSRRKKIVVITLSVILAIVLAIGITGVAVFYHYYNKLNVQDRDEIDATERTIKLFDDLTGERYSITISLIELADADVELLDNWFISGKELVITIPKDPATMTVQEHVTFVQQILRELRRLKQEGDDKRLVIKIRNQKDGKDLDLEIDSKFIAEGEDYVAIMEYLGSKGDQRLTISYDGDISALTEDTTKELYVVIANAIRALQKARFVLQLKDSATGNEVELVVYLEEVSEEQAKILVAVTETLVLSDLPEDINGLDEEQRKALIERVLNVAEESLIPHYTLVLRDPESGKEYNFVVIKTELSDAQLAKIVKQIDRGTLDLELKSDPNELDSAKRKKLFEDILAAIDRLDNPPKIYQLKLMDRKSGTAYVLSFDENEVTDAQLVELLTAIGNNMTVVLHVEKDPASMEDSQRQVLFNDIVVAIRHPLRMVPLKDKASGKPYYLYFYDEDMSTERLSYLKQQIASGEVLSLSIAKAPDDMQADELELLLRNIIAMIKGEQIIEYRIPVRDKESGTAYVLKFTKLEVEDIKVFGYLLEQTQRGGVLDMAIAGDPSSMSMAERKALFAAAAEAVKEKINEESNPELLAQMMQHLNNIAKNPVQHTDDIYNVLLVGTDERDQYDAKNSDTMILVTINYKDETITMTSLMRDTHVKVKYMSGGKEREIETKLNAAYAVGGIKTLITTVESHFGLKIDNYVKVNWFSFIDVFEVLGSVKVNVKNNNKGEDDLETLNGVLQENCKLFGYDYASEKLTKYGEQYLDPVQLLAFVRYRTGDADFGRTTRQREALVAVFNKFKSSSLLKINDVLETVLPLLTTDLSDGNCASLLLKFPSIVGFKVQQHRFPGEKEFTSKGGDLWPDWQKGLSNMYKMAYGSLCPEQYK